jgi:hypothetical protein
MSVLSRRKEIESHLDSLKITRYPEDSMIVITEIAPPREKEKVTQQEKPVEKVQKIEAPVKTKSDTTVFKAPVTEKKLAGYSFKAADPHMVVLVLDKVDVVYVIAGFWATIKRNFIISHWK